MMAAMRNRSVGDARDRGFAAFMGDPTSAVQEDAGAPPPIDALLADRGELPAAYARIVRTVFALDVEPTFERVTRGLRRGKTPANRREYGEIVDDLDEASELSLLAHQLVAASAVTVARYEADLEVLMADMRAQATAALVEERAAAERKKQVTDADVTARMAGSYPAEYRRLTGLLAEAKAAAKFIASLPDQWGARRRELDAMLRTVRKT